MAATPKVVPRALASVSCYHAAMRRLLRALAEALTFCSLAAALLAACLLVRSYFRADKVEYDSFRRQPDVQWVLWSADGSLGSYARRSYGDVEPVRRVSANLRLCVGDELVGPWAKRLPRWHFEPFACSTVDGVPRFAYIAYAKVPHWVLSVLLLAAPARRLARARGRKSGRAIPCDACGCDLRATPDRCPECGIVLRTAEKAGTGEPSRPDGD
jgi:hypothetical protein